MFSPDVPVIGQHNHRVQPVMLVDAADGKYQLPIVVLTEFQYAQLVGDIKAIVVAEVKNAIEQLEDAVAERACRKPSERVEATGQLTLPGVL
jgi:hypothetical protein